MKLDYLILAAHPDDAEIFCSGSLLRWQQTGRTVGIADLTRGEAGSSGSVAERDAETAAADRILRPTLRVNLNLPDGGLADVHDHRRPVIELIRETRPDVIIAPWGPCRHPDHTAVHHLARSSFFFAGNATFAADGTPFRPKRLIFHLEIQDNVLPSFVVDISDQFDDKMRAIQSYSSQFYSPERGETGTYIGSKLFMDKLHARFAHFGSLINCRYGEPYLTPDTIRIDDPLTTLEGGRPCA